MKQKPHCKQTLKVVSAGINVINTHIVPALREAEAEDSQVEAQSQNKN